MAEKYRVEEDNRAGFTLIEVLMAVFILAIGILSWAATQSHNIRSRDVSGRSTAAVSLAQSRLDDMSDWVSNWDENDDDQTFTTTNYVVDKTSFTIVETVNGTSQLVPDGRSMWRVQIDVQWESLGSKTVHLERIVKGL